MQNQKALEILASIRQSQSDRSDMIGHFVEACRQAKAPVVKVFAPTGTEMFLDVQLAFLLTERTDWQYFYWYLSPRMGMCVADTRITSGKNWVPFEEWDPQGDLFAFRYWGATGVRPEEWVKRRLAGESDES